jgi:hypothetical protein
MYQGTPNQKARVSTSSHAAKHMFLSLPAVLIKKPGKLLKDFF